MDREKLFDAGIEAGYPHEFISYWLERFPEVAGDQVNSRDVFVDYLHDRAEQ